MAKKHPLRRVVAYSGHLNQFDHLPPRFVSPCGRYEILTHQAPRFTVGQDNITQFNFDLGLLTNTDPVFKGPAGRNDLLIERHCKNVMVFPRETKFTQQLGMSELARKLDLKHFRHIRTFMTNAERPSSHFFGQDIGGMIVIKPIDGARGIGQLIVNLDEILPANVAHLLTLAKDGKDAFLEYVNTCAPHVEYHIGHGEVEEGIGALAEGYVVQEMVRNVENEYRIILTPESEPAFICARKRDSLPLDANANSHDYRQATGVARFRHEMAILSTIDYPHLNEVLVLLKELQLPLNSVDLFITTDGKWGIFEYCPQWGTQGLPLKDITDWLIAQVVGFLKQKDRHD